MLKIIELKLDNLFMLYVCCACQVEFVPRTFQERLVLIQTSLTEIGQKLEAIAAELICIQKKLDEIEKALESLQQQLKQVKGTQDGIITDIGRPQSLISSLINKEDFYCQDFGNTWGPKGFGTGSEQLSFAMLKLSAENLEFWRCLSNGVMIDSITGLPSASKNLADTMGFAALEGILNNEGLCKNAWMAYATTETEPNDDFSDNFFHFMEKRKHLVMCFSVLMFGPTCEISSHMGIQRLPSFIADRLSRLLSGFIPISQKALPYPENLTIKQGFKQLGWPVEFLEYQTKMFEDRSKIKGLTLTEKAVYYQKLGKTFLNEKQRDTIATLDKKEFDNAMKPHGPISVPLHGFAADMTQKIHPHKKVMINSPATAMKVILKKEFGSEIVEGESVDMVQYNSDGFLATPIPGWSCGKCLIPLLALKKKYFDAFSSKKP